MKIIPPWNKNFLALFVLCTNCWSVMNSLALFFETFTLFLQSKQPTNRKWLIQLALVFSFSLKLEPCARSNLLFFTICYDYNVMWNKIKKKIFLYTCPKSKKDGVDMYTNQKKKEIEIKILLWKNGIIHSSEKEKCIRFLLPDYKWNFI